MIEALEKNPSLVGREEIRECDEKYRSLESWEKELVYNIQKFERLKEDFFEKTSPTRVEGYYIRPELESFANQYIENSESIRVDLGDYDSLDGLMNDFYKYYNYLIYENKGYSYMPQGSGCYLVEYNLTNRAKDRHREVESKAGEIISKLGLRPGMDQVEMVLKIHDYIIANADYNTEAFEAGNTTDDDHSAYGVLIKGKGVCSSYAKAFQLICTRLEIPCLYIEGDTSGGRHAWNKVYLDGDWYSIDLTFDDPIGSKLMVNYDYFLVADEKMKDHREDRSKDYPPATREKDYPSKLGVTYFLKDGSPIENIASFDEAGEYFEKLGDLGYNYAAIRLTDPSLEPGDLLNIFREKFKISGTIWTNRIGNDILIFSKDEEF